MKERLHRSEMGLWKGPNIAVSRQTIIPSRADVEVPFIITPESLPQSRDWNLGKSLPLRVSVRSRFAQAGLDIDDEAGSNIFRQKQAMQDVKGNFWETKVKVINRALRPIEVFSGNGLFRLYAERASPLEGRALTRMMMSNKIKMDGKEGVDWQWMFGEDRETPVGIYLRIDSANRGWIPPHAKNKPILIDDRSANYREIINELLEAVPLGRDTQDILWIGQTVKITLNGVDGILDHVSHTHPDPNHSRGFGTQTNSRLIDDGTNWPIKVEIFSKTTWGEMPNFVRMRFIKSRL